MSEFVFLQSNGNHVLHRCRAGEHLVTYARGQEVNDEVIHTYATEEQVEAAGWRYIPRLGWVCPECIKERR